eukprot:scaffold345127_cov24-Prasinocladus_malaysianus.AAC.1
MLSANHANLRVEQLTGRRYCLGMQITPCWRLATFNLVIDSVQSGILKPPYIDMQRVATAPFCILFRAE